MRAVFSLLLSCWTANRQAMSEADVRRPAAATPSRSSRQRCACLTTGDGRSSNASSWMKAVASTKARSAARTLADRFKSLSATSDQAIRFQEICRHLFNRLLINIDRGIEPGHDMVVEL